jgi:hypothetical protein
MSNIRAQYWLEASDNIGAANHRDMRDPEFWAAWISALVNSNMALASDEVMAGVQELMLERQSNQKQFQEIVRRDLQG